MTNHLLGSMLASSLAVGCDVAPDEPTNEEPTPGSEAAEDEGEDDAAPAENEEEQQRGTEEGSTTIDAAASLMLVTEAFVWTDGSTTVAPEGGEAEVLAGVEEGLPACATVETDNLTWIEITYTACEGAYGLATLDGTIRAELELELGTCGAWPCVTGVFYNVTELDLQLDDTQLDGALQIYVAADPGEAVWWDGGLTVVLPNGHPMDYATTAEYATVDGCTDFNFTAGVKRSLLPWTLSADGLHACGGCPDAGTVQLDIAGLAMGWTYVGDGTATAYFGDAQWSFPTACE